MKSITGDLVQLASEGRFDVIVHGCNCFHTMGAGIAKAIRAEFPEAYRVDKKTAYGDPEKLGTISVARVMRAGRPLAIVNGYTQHQWQGTGLKADYAAIHRVMVAVRQQFSGCTIAYPKIGAGLAGGDWPTIEAIINEALKGEDHTLVLFEQSKNGGKTMQQTLFDEPSVPAKDLALMEHASPDYAPRTGDNARGADVTVAFASHYDTAGERLTARVAGKRYIAVPFGSDIDKGVAQLVWFLRARQGNSLNIAGNGIYSLSVGQDEVNQWVYEVLKRVHAQVPLKAVRSGGQTGVDTAGLVAGLALGVPATGLYPKGFKRRSKAGKDFQSTADVIENELRAAAGRIRK